MTVRVRMPALRSTRQRTFAGCVAAAVAATSVLAALAIGDSADASPSPAAATASGPASGATHRSHHATGTDLLDRAAGQSEDATPTPAPTPDASAGPTPTPPTGAVAAGDLAANGIPTVALDAYNRAAARVAVLAPTCSLPWSLLAAIGRVESNHGRFHGTTLYSNGDTLPRIVGPVLDGTSTALILDTDHGLLDGDPVYDRAVGPMQFIPGTWARWGSDGNGDGKADPSNIYDAALAAGRYLCAAAGNVSTPVGKSVAVLAYNHSADYVALVLSLEASYAGHVTTVPTTSQLPPPLIALDPANPAAPPALVQDPTLAEDPALDAPAASPSPTPEACPTGTTTPTPTPTPDAATAVPVSSAAASPSPTCVAASTPTPAPGTTPAPSPSASPSDPSSVAPTPSTAPSPTTEPTPVPSAAATSAADPSPAATSAAGTSAAAA